MGKVRRRTVPASKTGATPVRNRTYAKPTSVSVYNPEASVVLEGVNPRNNISKKLKQKIKHENFMKKLTKPTKKKPKPYSFNLNTLREELKEVQAGNLDKVAKPHKPLLDGPKILSKKKRNNIKKQEMERFAAVVNYSAFKEDPVTAVQKHLLNTLVPAQAP